MAKELKVNIKNTQIANAVNLKGIRSRLGKGGSEETEENEKKPSGSKSKKSPSKAPKENLTPSKDETRESTPALQHEAAPPQQEIVESKPVIKHSGKSNATIVESPKIHQEKEAAISPPQEPALDLPKQSIKKEDVAQSSHQNMSATLTPKITTSEELPLGPTGKHIKDIFSKPEPKAPSAKSESPKTGYPEKTFSKDRERSFSNNKPHSEGSYKSSSDRPPYKSSYSSERGDQKPYKSFERKERPERSENSEQGSRPERPYRSDRGDRPERSDRPYRSDRGDRPERSDRPYRSDRGDRPERSDRPYRSDRGDRPERAPRSENTSAHKGERGDRPERSERPWERNQSPRGDRDEQRPYNRNQGNYPSYNSSQNDQKSYVQRSSVFGPKPTQDWKSVSPRREENELGPTGKHINDILPKKRKPPGEFSKRNQGDYNSRDRQSNSYSEGFDDEGPNSRRRDDGSRSMDFPALPPEEHKMLSRKFQGRQNLNLDKENQEEDDDKVSKKKKSGNFKEFKDIKPIKGKGLQETRARGQVKVDEGEKWRKKRPNKMKKEDEEKKQAASRPSDIKIRLPISVKDLAQEMKIKSAQIIAKLFMQGVIVTLNDLLEDDTTVQLLGEEFGCSVVIDTSEAERIQITDKSVEQEIEENDPESLVIKPPVVTFMGHVDHGKTSLIDYIRKSQIAASEAGAITQHIGAFSCSIPQGTITILDTPGHEAFTAMRARGTSVTDIVILVIAGDEGIRQQTIEALHHAKTAGVPIVVAINKCDKPNFDQDRVYRELAENNLLPEAWGGEVITVSCSAITGKGIPELLEMIHLQAEVLELKANPKSRARGVVLESEMHKGMGAVATVLVQNGTLKKGDALVFGQHWGIVKTMRNEHGKDLLEAPPSTPVELTGLSGLPEAGNEFIVVENAKEAKAIAEVRQEQHRQTSLQGMKMRTIENLLQQAQGSEKKVLNLIIRADVQGSLEALKASLLKIDSDKVDLNITFAGIGEISESDVELAAASKAAILGFHTRIESHAEGIIKELGVTITQHDIIYHAIDDIKRLMTATLDKIAQEEIKGHLIVKATFKASQLGMIAGCEVTDGTIHRNNKVRVLRDGVKAWEGGLSSLKRGKDDVREVAKGFECGVLLRDFNNVKVGDILESFEIHYISQEL